MSHDDFTQYPEHPSFPDDFITDAYRYVPPQDDLSDVDERFVIDFRTYGDLDDGQRWSTWLNVEPLSRGPEPRPDWVVTSQGAIDTELGVLKTGKEADVHLVERADPYDTGSGVVMAAKRYRSPEHRSFHRAASYTEGRSMKRSRDERALKRKSTFGRLVAAGEWAVSEWGALVRLWNLGLPVPYPVQIDEHRDHDGVDHRRRRGRHRADGAPARPDPALARPPGGVLRAGQGCARAHGAERRRARRPLGVQHPGGG